MRWCGLKGPTAKCISDSDSLEESSAELVPKGSAVIAPAGV